jgi:hypothetical protein
MEGLPDIFGPFSKGMVKLHTEVIHNLNEDAKYINMDIRLDLLQCTFKEYIDMDHDHNYTWYQLNFDSDSERKVSIGFNDTIYKRNKDERERIIRLVNNAWDQNKLGIIRKTKEIQQTNDLKMHSDEMIQSAHFLANDKIIKDGNNKVQLFKIIYTYSSLKPLLDKLRDFG